MFNQAGDVAHLRSFGQGFERSPYLLMNRKGEMGPSDALFDEGSHLVGAVNAVPENSLLGVELCFCDVHDACLLLVCCC